ncbi:MAG: hypothetical protein P1V51_14525 [Deltaproteobacteria bacterium]|nr:hypothetical protein [Deltaproteobacteria bacterium]
MHPSTYRRSLPLLAAASLLLTPPRASLGQEAPDETGAEASAAVEPSAEAAPPDESETAALRERITALEDRLELMEALAEDAQAPPPTALPTFLNALNPRITIFGNAVARADTREVHAEGHGHGEEPAAGEEPLRIDNTFYLRETEIDFRAAVDPFVDGLITLAIEGLPDGSFELHVEEAIVTLRRLPLPILSDPPGGLVLRAGKMRAEFGKLNLMHTHDLPQTTRPLVHRTLVGEEGALGSGVSGSFFLPLDRLDEASTLQATIQLLGPQLAGSENGTHLLGSLTWSRDLGASHRLELGGIVHHGFSPRFPELADDLTFGGELIYLWRPAGKSLHRGLIVGGQYLQSERPDEEVATARGFYGFVQGQLSRELFAGLRYDQSEAHHEEGWTRGLMPYVSWYPSEFFRLRLGYEQTFFGHGEPELGTLWFELNVVFGSHPPHPYWVNR